jgi:uncharacterized protein
MSSGYNEQELAKPTRDLHRALASLQEELEAIDYYQQRMDGTDDPGLKAILAHNRDEEAEHAAMLTEWLRRNSPSMDAALKTYLFSSKPVTEIEAGAADAGLPSDLGIGQLKD